MSRVVITIQYGNNRHTVYSFFSCILMSQSLLYPYGDFHHIACEIYNSIYYKLQNSTKVDSVVIIAILSMSYIITRIVKT